ncbi:MAG: pentapeptide repeat-containing protein [Salinivirgaceae bacterium]
MLETTKIGNKIAEARKRLNLSQAELAQQLFISSQAVGKWERGESMPDITTLIRLAVILGIDLNYLSENFQSTVSDQISNKSLENQSDELSTENQNLTAGKAGKKLNWDMSKLNLIDNDFSGLKELHEKLSSSNMQRCQFVGSEMSGLLLKNNNIDDCDFSNSDISKSHVQKSYLANNQFKNCSLKETEFTGSYVNNCDFTGADFTGAKVKSGGLENNTVTNTVWKHTTFIDTHLVNTVFEGTLEDCTFENCTFTKVKFQNTTIINSFFKNNRKMKKVEFINCKADKITYAFLKNNLANLTGVTLLSGYKGGNE